RFLPGGVGLWANVPRPSASSLISPKGPPHPAARTQASSACSATRNRRLRVPAKRSGKGGAPGRRLKTLWRRTGAPPFPRERPFGAETSGIRIQEVAGEFAAPAPLLQGAVDGFAEQGGVVGA